MWLLTHSLVGGAFWFELGGIRQCSFGVANVLQHRGDFLPIGLVTVNGFGNLAPQPRIIVHQANHAPDYPEIGRRFGREKLGQHLVRIFRFILEAQDHAAA